MNHCQLRPADSRTPWVEATARNPPPEARETRLAAGLEAELAALDEPARLAFWVPADAGMTCQLAVAGDPRAHEGMAAASSPCRAAEAIAIGVRRRRVDQL